MAGLLASSVLSDDERQVVNLLTARIRKDEHRLLRLDRYFEGQQRLEHIGIAVPPELRQFETVVNVPRMAVTEPARRQKMRAFYRAGNSTQEDASLRSHWDYNNLGSESGIQQVETKIFGRAFVSVGANADDPQQPLIVVEDTKQFSCDVDQQRRRMRSALRLYRDDANRSTAATLYLPDSTVHLVRDSYGWRVTDRDDHGLGVVPIVMFMNRRRAGQWGGVSEMADVIGLTDSIARMVSVMQLGAETIAIPQLFITGASKNDFTDRDGKPIPVWESYLTALKALENADAKIYRFAGADLDNFNKAVNNMFAWCAAVLGLPTRYAGQQTANPAAEGAIRADESRLVMNVEDMNTADASSWAWVMDLAERFRTGSWGTPNTIRPLFHDPATPTYSQRADSIVKMRQVDALSVEGMWDELGWDEARKRLERQRLDAESSSDPMANLAREFMAGTPAVTGARTVTDDASSGNG